MELAGKVPGGAEPLCPSNPDVVAQLYHAVHEELTVSLQDVLLRRTGIGTSRCQGADCAEGIAHRLAPLLRWSPRRVDAEVEAYRAHVARSQRFRV
jgi:glycerol-3-phosphate dehydrogenase